MKLTDFTVRELSEANNFFAAEVDTDGSLEEIATGLEEAGITARMILDNNPELKEKYTDQPKGVVTSKSTKGKEVQKPKKAADKEAILETSKKAQARPAQQEQYLVKMDRANPLFENSGYRFTKDHPYAVVEADDVNKVLEEEGFHIATPREVEEYYS